ncbi:glycosyltransferase family 2 protein [Tessaracoccus sp. MC1865]|uniref:glycosyltransferase n=1 Tax=Tessaracoccus sp. MC1865 TaxID=2760310 RepID=UPI001600BD14|nr:glycosyltransferase [Tessaracoccus sp. MC1865]MBB1484508.1 glycosyltransferase family 2 protein [Tessaracoccus sp. MC1865]QTO38392.1 glycosyltransferase family 2 protein [Tessaracoccus sp. MC1865]
MTEEPQRGVIDDDLWSWIEHEDPVADVPEVDPSSVVAVMVTHNAAEWLPRQLLSVAMLSTRPGRIVVVDTGSTDETPELVARALDEGVIDDFLRADATTTFGGAVHAALADTEPEWIWLLHDDSAPHRDALAHLLEGARQADVVVPKLLQPKRRNYPETLSEVGQAITPGGLRVPMVEAGDVDQGQTEPRDVLGASTAGLLIRGGTWREVGGLAPEVERHRDGVDFGWRANALGFRVLTWPAASLHHRRVGHTGERPSKQHPHLDDRLAALRIAGARGASGFGLAAASVFRALGFLLGKSPSFAAAEMRALGRYQRSSSLTRSLKDRFPTEDMTPSDLLPNRWWPVRNAADKVGHGLSERYRNLTDVSADTSIDELTGDDFAGGQIRRRVFSPVTALVVVLLIAAFIAGRTLLGAGPVSGGGMLPAPSSLGAAWQAYLTGEAPWLGLAAFASLGGLGSPGWFAFLAVLLTPLLAGLAALALLRRVGLAAGPAAAVSAVWAGATILLGLVTAGDVSGMVLSVAGPLLARAVLAVVRSEASGAERLRAPAGAGFWLIVVASVWPAALLFVTIAGVAWGARHRHRVVDVVVGVLPAWIFFAPWLPTLARYPGRLLTGVDPLAWPDFPPASYALVVGRILPSGLPVWANVAFFAVLGVVALFAVAGLRYRQWLWTLVGIAAPLVLGTLLSRLTLEVDGGTARALLSPWALLVVAALLAPVVFAERDAGRKRRAALLALVLAALLAFGAWGWVGFAGPVRSTTSVLPGYVRDVMFSPRDTRALAVELSPDGTVDWNVVDARQPRWGSAERNPAGSFAGQFTTLVHAIASGSVPDDLAERLRLMGVSHVWLRGFDDDQRAAMDNLEGLVGAAADDRSVVWTVSGLVSRVTYAAEDPEPVPVTDGHLPEGDDGRYLVVAEPAESDWVATLNGRDLERTSGFSWAALDTEMLTFDAGAEAGELVVEPAPRDGRFVLHLLVMLGLALLAAPTLGAATAARRGQE